MARYHSVNGLRILVKQSRHRPDPGKFADQVDIFEDVRNRSRGFLQGHLLQKFRAC